MMIIHSPHDKSFHVHHYNIKTLYLKFDKGCKNLTETIFLGNSFFINHSYNSNSQSDFVIPQFKMCVCVCVCVCLCVWWGSGDYSSSPSWFFLHNSETLKAVTLKFSSI